VTNHTFTILGGTGFIGTHLRAHLDELGYECWCPRRDDAALFERNLGHTINCVGVTAAFRSRRFETVEAHVTYVADVLRRARFESFLQLSSTRVYLGAVSGNEDATLKAVPTSLDYLYNLSKLMGESLCLSMEDPRVRVARLSNVYGSDLSSENFLSTILRDALTKGRVVLRTTLDSAKDYVSVIDVVGALVSIAQRGTHRLYNVASGKNVSNSAVLDIIARETGCSVDVAATAVRVTFPRIGINRISEEFGFTPMPVLDRLAGLIERYRMENWN
jgi:nucleoside-diphosphate-sugar epimerase